LKREPSETGAIFYFHSPWHEPVKLSYGAWIKFAESQIKAGNEQKQCPVCDRYFFPCEWGEELGDKGEIYNLKQFKRLTNEKRKGK
jgi:hypothetical protein